MNILLIHETQTNRFSLEDTLTASQCKVDRSDSIKKGFFLASTNPYDVIVIDSTIQGQTTIPLVQNIRKKGVTTPILLLTNGESVTQKIKAMHAGADAYLEQPFFPADFMTRIHTLRRYFVMKSSILKADTLELHTAHQTVLRAGREIALTKKEYRILKYFMHHPHIIITKEHIINHVLDSQKHINHTMEEVLKQIKMKIDTTFPDERQLIMVIQGFGYMLQMP